MILFGKKEDNIEYKKEIEIFAVIFNTVGDVGLERIEDKMRLSSIMVEENVDANSYFESHKLWLGKKIELYDLIGKSVLYTNDGFKKIGYFYSVELEDIEGLNFEWISPIEAVHLIKEEHQLWGLQQSIENSLDL